MPLGDAKPEDPTRTLQQIVAASGCGFKRQEYMPVDPAAFSAELKAMMDEHLPHCWRCQQEAREQKARERRAS